jgi:hypothetical protein
MARPIPTLESTKALTGLDFLYSVDTPVGKGADNKRIADVQLVQVFLRHFYLQNPALFKKLSKPTTNRNAQEILLDGKVGGQVIDGITEFQKDLIRKGAGAIFVDGRVSIPVSGLRVANSKHVYTIIQLNLAFFNTDPANAAFNRNLEDHPIVKGSCPILAAELLSNRLQQTR